MLAGMQNPASSAGRWLAARPWLGIGLVALLVGLTVAGAIRFHHQPWLVVAVAGALLGGPIVFGLSAIEFRALARLADAPPDGVRRRMVAAAAQMVTALTILVLAVSPLAAMWAALLVLVPSSGK